MTTPTMNSVYPRQVAELLPAARDLTERTGAIPSRNRLMKEFRVGRDKAKALLEALNTDTALPAADPVEVTGEMPPSPVEPVADTRAAPDTVLSTTRTPEAVEPVADAPARVASALPIPSVAPGSNITSAPRRATAPARPWVLLLLAAPAFVAIWSGWVGLGGLTGFGVVHPLPGIWDSFSLNTAITLPIGVEAYAAYALRAWLSGSVPARARRFAKWSAIGSLVLGALGQVAYHLMESAGITAAPWWITTLVACLPVVVLGMGAALAHLLHSTDDEA
ncbi:ABC transporter permease [Plantactinospora solaniradicis]|uniref:ABC transporter permease n=1 Tax=Plantactinospora solaniradicis TaxID=1723736 RepID=A0ABW1K244_9ACTN